MGDDEIIRHKDSDEYVKEQLIPKLFLSYELYAKGDLLFSFRTLVTVLSLFLSKDFPLKLKLIEDMKILRNYFNSLGSKPANKFEQIQRGKSSDTLDNLLLEFMININTSLDYLGVLLKNTTQYNDLHRRLSEQNFGDDFTPLQEYKKELEKVDGKRLVGLMSNNIIYELYALWRYEDAL